MPISAVTGEGLETLRLLMAEKLRSGEQVHRISLPAGDGGRIAWLHSRGEVLDQQVNPTIGAHGGRAELVAVEQGTAYLRLGGGCQGCAMATVTLSQGIETAIIQAVPEITSVVDVTDHQSGTNPYFEAAKK